MHPLRLNRCISAGSAVAVSCTLGPCACVCCGCGTSSAAMCRIEKNEDGTLTVHYKGKDGQEHSLVTGIVMFGTGRKPNTNKLGIEVLCSFANCLQAQAHRHGSTFCHQ